MTETPYSEAEKIYGPYLGKDGRLRIRVRWADARITTVSYPKYLVELHIGRYLSADETVDHIDRDPLNNNLSNLRIMPVGEHQRQDNKRVVVHTVICSACGTPFTPTRGQRRNKRGPFCSKRCSGIGSHYPKEHRTKVIVEYVDVKSLAGESLQGMEPKSVNPLIDGNTERSPE